MLLLLPSEALARQDNGNGRKEARAVRVPPGSLRVDGRLDEAAWRDVPALTELKTTGLMSKSAGGVRLGGRIPADVRARLMRNAEVGERGKKYNIGS